MKNSIHTNMKRKSPKQTRVETRYLLMPQHLNQHGTAFGGVIMSWIDSTAAMAAQRHAGNDVVTASIDSISFHAPASLGDQVVLNAILTYTGRTSMEVEVEVFRENPIDGETQLSTKAYLTFVAVDTNHNPVPVPILILDDEDDAKRYEQALERVAKRKEARQK